MIGRLLLSDDIVEISRHVVLLLQEDFGFKKVPFRAIQIRKLELGFLRIISPVEIDDFF
jgi:hypothetical protein